MSALSLVCDEFLQGSSYSTRRPVGSGDWLLIYTDDGEGRIVVDGETYLLRPGSAVLYAPGDAQDYATSSAPEKWRLLWAHFLPLPHWQALLDWPRRARGIRLVHFEEGEMRERFSTALRRMISLSRRPLPGVRDLTLNALEEALLWSRAALSDDPWLAMDHRVRRAVDYLAVHLKEPFDLGSLARHAGLSPSRLSHLFRQALRTSPQRFLEHQRMEHAANLLRLTNLAIGEVASEVGYSDPFYFSNRFRRHSGRNPRAYRHARS